MSQSAGHGRVHCRLWQHPPEISLYVARQEAVVWIVFLWNTEPATWVIEPADTALPRFAIFDAHTFIKRTSTFHVTHCNPSMKGSFNNQRGSSDKDYIAALLSNSVQQKY